MLPCNKGYIPCFPGFGQNHDAAQRKQNRVASSYSKHIDESRHLL